MHDASANLAKQAFKEGKTVRQLAHTGVAGTSGRGGKPITKQAIDEYLDPWSMTLPGGEGSAGGVTSNRPTRNVSAEAILPLTPPS